MTFFLFLSLVLVLSTESMVAPTVSYEYDELLLALQWPTSYCNSGNNNCNYAIPLEFKVHGLWLNKNLNAVNCLPRNPHIMLNYQQISTYLSKDWEYYWPNLNSQKYREYLWDHEYETHGYCFTNFRNPVVYFETALDFATRINIGNIMATMRLSSGQTIERGRFYQVEDFRQVTIAGRKLILGLRCNYARNSATPQLLDIVFCAYINMTLKNCADNNVNNKCWTDRNGVSGGGWFQFPEAPASSSGSSRSPHPPHIFFLLLLIFYIEWLRFEVVFCNFKSQPSMQLPSREMQGNLVRDSELAVNLRGS